ncbi:histone-lysine N-methyltransferase setd7 [Plakobranchus ocellatus]|uniref:Histone-lysine N-methyltransferase setd7 n=1 Tax=Plakobranchus ocellatus TaxID=259542 RepID=A0AAV4CZ04_9GAST|nr:histone-lysine N-methyltransferase setd7 [Plakobranchus ocellatus]
MGHELNIHRDFHRLYESTVEIAKVSRVLVAIDVRQAGRYSGKSLNEIGLDDIAFHFEEFGQEQLDNVDELVPPVDMTQEEPYTEISDIEDLDPLAPRNKKNVPSLDSSSDEEIAEGKTTSFGLKRKWTSFGAFYIEFSFQSIPVRQSLSLQENQGR